MSRALFVVSTGRCGTQWLAHALAQRLGDSAVVEHEPLDNDYAPRAMLAARDPHRLDAELAQPILEHIDSIEETLQSKPYIECGYPAWSTIPYFVERFRDRVKIVHLVRDPIHTAYSWLTQHAYTPPMSPHLRERVLLSPFDDGVRHPSYQKRWASLTPYEKALYYWLEVNTLGVELAESTAVPVMRIRFEELFRPESIDRLLAFAGLTAVNGEGEPPRVDEFRFALAAWDDPHLISRHPEVVSLASKLGYGTNAIDEESLRKRYLRVS